MPREKFQTIVNLRDHLREQETGRVLADLLEEAVEATPLNLDSSLTLRTRATLIDQVETALVEELSKSSDIGDSFLRGDKNRLTDLLNPGGVQSVILSGIRAAQNFSGKK